MKLKSSDKLKTGSSLSGKARKDNEISLPGYRETSSPVCYAKQERFRKGFEDISTSVDATANKKQE